MNFKTTRRAVRDLKRILGYSTHQHGVDAADRYNALLSRAMEDVAAEPFRRGSHPVAPNSAIRSYPIANSARSSPAAVRIRNPAHQLVYRMEASGIIQILAIVGVSYPAERAAETRRSHMGESRD